MTRLTPTDLRRKAELAVQEAIADSADSCAKWIFIAIQCVQLARIAEKIDREAAGRPFRPRVN